MPSHLLIAASAGVILTLGLIHLLYTFSGHRLFPRDPALQERMALVAPRISTGTTMWRAWIGFNASHSMGAILFGMLYLHQALATPAALFGSPFLCGLGEVFLLGYVLVGRRYWFNVPVAGVLLALLLYSAGLVLAGTGAAP